MDYTVRYAHLKELPNIKIGQILKSGDKLGIMGNTGFSKGAHLHIDLVEGLIYHLIRMSQIGYDKEYIPNIKQLNYFIDKDLFNIEPVITSFFYDPEYKKLFGKDHPGYDVVPSDRLETKKHYGIYWNRSKEGKVLSVGYDTKGYGNYILVGFEA